MASDRDTLAALPGMVVHDDELHHAIDQSLAGLYTDWGLSEGLPAPVTVAVHIERDLRAAGWRPPAQVITTAAELDALPDDSIVVDHHNAGWQMADRDYDGTAIWMYHTAARTSAELLGAGARVALVFVPIEAVSDDDQ